MDVCINEAICDQEKVLHFVEQDYVGGIFEFMNTEFLTFWHKNKPIDKMLEVRCRRFDHVLQNHGSYFDILSLDVEGGELEVLRSLKAIVFGVILVEADERYPLRNIQVRSLLQNKGYSYDGNHNRSQWFVNTNFHSIYGDLEGNG